MTKEGRNLLCDTDTSDRTTSEEVKQDEWKGSETEEANQIWVSQFWLLSDHFWYGFHNEQLSLWNWNKI